MAQAPSRKKFTKTFDDLTKVIDVDDSRGRSVPINMNFIEEGYLSKDTGVSLFGAVETTKTHSLFHYKKKDGTSYLLRGHNTKLQSYNFTTQVWDDLSPTYTADAEFGFFVYDDTLWGCNGVENYFKWDGTTFTEYASAPKGNILEVFEDRMCVSGVTAEPLTVYYSAVSDPSDWSDTTKVLKPLGTDSVTNLKNYYGSLLIFKKESIWKMTFVYDQVLAVFVPKLEQQSGAYGACSRKAVSWVENDIWFFTGKEVRAIGFVDNQSGQLGINKSVISEPIKETVNSIDNDLYDEISTFYFERRFYLSVPLDDTVNDTTFVCHLLYSNNWTKYTGRQKGAVNDFVEYDGSVYSNNSNTDYGTVKWNGALLNDNGVAIAAQVFFQRVENEEFNTFNTYRYLDLMFKDKTAVITVEIRQDANDGRLIKTKDFYLGSTVEGKENSLGEVDPGHLWVADAFGEDISTSPFLKKRVSFLSKAQSLVVGIKNSNVSESFTVAAYGLSGFQMPPRLFAGSKIVSMN